MQIAVLIYMMVQAVTYGIGIILVLATPLQAKAMELVPIVVVASAIVSIPVSWLQHHGCKLAIGARGECNPAASSGIPIK